MVFSGLEDLMESLKREYRSKFEESQPDEGEVRASNFKNESGEKQ